MATTASTELAIIEPGGYLALNHSPDEIAEMLDVLAENLLGETLKANDLPRIGMPAGGGLAWEIPSDSGDVEPSKTITGIIVHAERTHTYWPAGQATGTPPVCSSVGPGSMAVGSGKPGGPCRSCPWNDYGTKIDEAGQPADGKACTERENWFMLVPDRPLPIVVSLSPGSLAAAKEYRDLLSSVGKRMSSVVTEIGLATDTNKKGKKYTYVVPRIAGHLSPAEVKAAREYAIGLKPVFAATTAAVAAEPQVSTVADIDAEGEEV